MSTSSSGSGSTNHSTNPTTAKHQLVSPEGFLRPVEVPEGVTKLVIYVGGSRDKIEEVLGVCKRINSTREGCMDLSILRSAPVIGYDSFRYLVFNFSKEGTFDLLTHEGFYQSFIQKVECYEVSYGLFIGKLRWAERALLFQGYVEGLGLD